MWRNKNKRSKQLIDFEIYNTIDPVHYRQLPKRGINNLRNQQLVGDMTPAHAAISIQDFRDAFLNTIAMVKNSTSSKNLELDTASNKKAKQSVGTHKSARHYFRNIDDVSESETFLRTFKYEAKKPKQAENLINYKYDSPYFSEITAQLENQMNISRGQSVVKHKQLQGSANINRSKNKLTSLIKLKHKGNNLVKKAMIVKGTSKINKQNSKKNQISPTTTNVKMASANKKKQISKKPVKKLVTSITNSEKSKQLAKKYVKKLAKTDFIILAGKLMHNKF